MKKQEIEKAILESQDNVCNSLEEIAQKSNKTVDQLKEDMNSSFGTQTERDKILEDDLKKLQERVDAGAIEPSVIEEYKKAYEESKVEKVANSIMEQIRENQRRNAEIYKAAVVLAKENPIAPYLLQLGTHEPFFGYVLRNMAVIPTVQIPTAGVMMSKDGSFQLVWNPFFIKKLKDENPLLILGILYHEMYHIICLHVSTRRYEPHNVANIAADLAINCFIPGKLLPAGCLMPGEKLKDLSPEQLKELKKEQIEAHKFFSQLIKSFPRNRSMEFYFQELIKAKGPSGKNGEQLVKELFDFGGLSDMDNHDGWDDLTEEEQQKVKDSIRDAMAKATAKADSSNSWGSISVDLQKEIREFISNSVPWELILKRFIGLTIQSNSYETYTRVSRRMPGVLPGYKHDYTSKVVVFIDQSGSVGDDALVLAFGELGSLAKQTEFVTYHFDDAVDANSRQEWKQGNSIPKALRTKCGGTNFMAPINYFNEHLFGKFDGMIIITDGYAAEPTKWAKVKTAWMITPECPKLAFNIPKRDFQINMKFPKQV